MLPSLLVYCDAIDNYSCHSDQLPDCPSLSLGGAKVSKSDVSGSGDSVSIHSSAMRLSSGSTPRLWR